MKVLITCPPMISSKAEYIDFFKNNNIEIHLPNTLQILSEDELMKLVPNFDGWIIGDDIASRKVICAGKNGRLKAAVKWGIGTDNIDFNAFKEFDIPITNTPNMFGDEVADLAIGYLIGLARGFVFIDREVRKGKWPKFQGMSLEGKKVGVVGYGDIGKSFAKKAQSLKLTVITYDPYVKSEHSKIIAEEWPSRIEECDFIVFTCSLNNSNKKMFNEKIIQKCKDSLMVVNVARGELLDEEAVNQALNEKRIKCVALDVFEKEPLPLKNNLRLNPFCILGSHNASNTKEAVKRTNELAIKKLMEYLN